MAAAGGDGSATYKVDMSSLPEDLKKGFDQDKFRESLSREIQNKLRLEYLQDRRGWLRFGLWGAFTKYILAAFCVMVSIMLLLGWCERRSTERRQRYLRQQRRKRRKERAAREKIWS